MKTYGVFIILIKTNTWCSGWLPKLDSRRLKRTHKNAGSVWDVGPANTYQLLWHNTAVPQIIINCSDTMWQFCKYLSTTLTQLHGSSENIYQLLWHNVAVLKTFINCSDTMWQFWKHLSTALTQCGSSKNIYQLLWHNVAVLKTFINCSDTMWQFCTNVHPTQNSGLVYNVHQW